MNRSTVLVLVSIATAVSPLAHADTPKISCAGYVAEKNGKIFDVKVEGEAPQGETNLYIQKDINVGDLSLDFQVALNDHSAMIRVLDNHSKFEVRSSSVVGSAKRFDLYNAPTNEPTLVAIYLRCGLPNTQ